MEQSVPASDALLVVVNSSAGQCVTSAVATCWRTPPSARAGQVVPKELVQPGPDVLLLEVFEDCAGRTRTTTACSPVSVRLPGIGAPLRMGSNRLCRCGTSRRNQPTGSCTPQRGQYPRCRIRHHAGDARLWRARKRRVFARHRGRCCGHCPTAGSADRTGNSRVVTGLSDGCWASDRTGAEGAARQRCGLPAHMLVTIDADAETQNRASLTALPVDENGSGRTPRNREALVRKAF